MGSLLNYTAVDKHLPRSEFLSPATRFLGTGWLFRLVPGGILMRAEQRGNSRKPCAPISDRELAICYWIGRNGHSRSMGFCIYTGGSLVLDSRNRGRLIPT